MAHTSNMTAKLLAMMLNHNISKQGVQYYFNCILRTAFIFKLVRSKLDVTNINTLIWDASWKNWIFAYAKTKARSWSAPLFSLHG